MDGSHKLRRFVEVGIAVLFATVVPVAAGAPLTPGAAQRLVSVYGASGAVKRLTASDRQWSQVIRGIASGNEGWLRVAVSIGPGLDAHPGEEVQTALGKALRKHAARVLAIAAFSVEEICGAPDVDEYKHLAPALAELRARELAVRNVTSSKLSSRRAECLAQFPGAEEALRKFFVVP